MKDNISKLNECYGCGVCVIGCPVRIIDLVENNDGFYSPRIIDQDKCIECGICLDICAYNHEYIALDQSREKIKVYGCKSKSERVIQNSTTAGLGYEIARKAIKENRQVCAVRYNIKELRAEHYLSRTEEDLTESQGSKYLPSFTITGFKALSLKEPGTIFGLPCQIDSFRRLIRRFKIEDKFQLVDLLCYGTPSLLIWREYLREEERHFGTIESVKFRSKIYGWQKSACIEIKGTEGTLIQPSSHNLFYKLFFSHVCLNKCCQGKCKYKQTSSSADIRIGDFWGEKYKTSKDGINVLLSFTSRGDDIVESLKETCVFEEATIEEAMERQPADNPPCSPMRKIGLACLRHHLPLKFVYPIVRYGNFVTDPQVLLSTIKNRLKK